MPFTTSAKNIMLDAVARGTAPSATITSVSLHTAAPGETGASEVTGGTPTYARKAVTWNAPTGGAEGSIAALTFDIPAGTTITHTGYWSAGGTFLAWSPVTNETYASQGTYTLNTSTLAIVDQ